MSNLETVQTIYEAFGAGDVETIMGLLADDVDFGSEAAQDIAPWHGRRRDGQVVLYRGTEDTALVAELLAS